MKLRHPVNKAHHQDLPLGARAADLIVGRIGSWRFILTQASITIVWMFLNTVLYVTGHWDPYPWILLNLMYSLQAGITGPLILLAGNRSSVKDRDTLEHTYADTEKMLEEILRNTELTLAIHNKVMDDK